ncbi:hypothetical protein [uncultured Sphingobium sp.]|uniref:hypothetical protein n=1 Tax=uncultured Sphingobium sp. TaxID=316087 RepID=UPI000EE0D70F|nr:hypothetical protein [Sphingobium sp.]|tara:strand:+ start:6958 stop:7191 length:234 start_codon:yes stop_codon:yes gene_type:complete
MNAFNPITTMQKLEAVGMDRRQAETLADELHHATTELVTKDELTKALDAQANTLTLRIGGMVAAMLALAVTLSKIFS